MQGRSLCKVRLCVVLQQKHHLKAHQPTSAQHSTPAGCSSCCFSLCLAPLALAAPTHLLAMQACDVHHDCLLVLQPHCRLAALDAR